ncbi:MAG: DUF1543 domain-containing protein [Deltaproteobacteria bacterium]|nr:DUF1543 domain-containing protein [Deltaproteobacteria bacterium]
MKLFLIHCGFYDQGLAEASPNIFEGHHNFYVIATDRHEAKQKAKEKTLFKEKKMHIDGIHEIDQVDGYRIILEKVASSGHEIKVTDYDEVQTI